MGNSYDVFLICTVREADDEDKKFIGNYIAYLREQGKSVYYPAENTNQVDSSGGYHICTDNCDGIMNSKEVHVYWTDKSQGTKFDLGMAFIQHRTTGKKIRLANRSKVEEMVMEQKQKEITKSFEMVLLKLDDLVSQ